jgi:zinc transporter ZupT
MAGLLNTPLGAAWLAAVIAVLAAAAGLQLAIAPHWARRLIPFSAGLLAGIVLFGILPELVEERGRWPGTGLLAAGVLLLWAIGRWVYAVCPACSHTHDHSLCAASLHGFAPPLVLAASLHAFLDGVGIAAARHDHGATLGNAVLFGVGLHKIPEGIALGIILLAALNSRRAALVLCLIVQAATPAGAALESWVSARVGTTAVSWALGLAGGSFLYLAYHAVHADLRRRGPAAALGAAVVGLASAALLQHSLASWHH